MAKTFNDFVLECTNYPHSQEHLDLMKECAELELTCQYLANQEFLQENSRLFGEGVELTSGYFAEAANPTDLEELYESVGKKKSNIKLKIFQGIRRIVGVFTNLFNRLVNKFDETTRSAKTAREMLAKAAINDEVIAKLKSIVADGKEAAKGFSPHERQPYTKKLKMKYQGSSEEYSMLRADLAAALSDDTIVAKVSEGDKFGAIAPKDVENALIQMTLGGNGAIEGAISNLASSFAKAKINGIVINANTKEIADTAKRMDKIKQKVDEVIQGMVDSVNATKASVNGSIQAVSVAMQAAGAAGQRGDGSDDGSKVGRNIAQAGRSIGEYGALLDVGVGKAMNQAYTAVNLTIGATTKVYMGLNTYRKKVSGDLISYLKTVPTSKGSGGSESSSGSGGGNAQPAGDSDGSGSGSK